MRPEPNTPPAFIAEALEKAMRHDPEARWSDTSIFARAVWDALLEHGDVGTHFDISGPLMLVLDLDASPEPHA